VPVTSSFKVILDSLYDGVYVVDRNRRIEYWNQGAERITGHPSGRVVGRHCFDNVLMHVDETGQLLCQGDCPLAKSMADGQEREAQIYLHHADGHRVPVLVRVAPVRDETGEIVGAVEVFSDNTSMMEALDKVRELNLAVIRDQLTGVGSRRLIESRLQATVSECRRYGVSAGVLVIDLDHFKRVNDEHGHDVGDRLLATVARTLRLNLRESDELGRWGGEEFVAVIGHVAESALLALANKLRELVARSSVEVGGKQIGATVSIGATLVGIDDTPESAFKRADQALYRSKNDGRNRVTFLA
jgi:diguanylate cyclase (GGDEF)-like protein/PAS domain S-box-containing protein